MLELNSKYQLGVFINADELIPTAEVFTTLLGLFTDKGFLPTTIQELQPNMNILQPKVRLTTPGGEWNLTASSNRLDIEKTPTSIAAENMQSLEDFAAEASEMACRVMEKYNKKANRLALVTFGFLPEMRAEELENVYKKLFQQPTFFKTNPPFEWNYRSASKDKIDINNKNEIFNVITSFNRVKGRLQDQSRVIDFDRIEANFDINTQAETTEYRFECKDIPDFCQKAIAARKSLISEFENLING